MPQNASIGLKLCKGRCKVVIFVFKRSDNDEKIITHLWKVAVWVIVATLRSQTRLIWV
jgi:hypothetical protein